MYFSIVQRILFAQILFYDTSPIKTRPSLTTRIEHSNLIIQPAGYIQRNTVHTFNMLLGDSLRLLYRKTTIRED